MNKEEYRQEPKGNDVVVIDGLGDYYLVYQGTWYRTSSQYHTTKTVGTEEIGTVPYLRPKVGFFATVCTYILLTIISGMLNVTLLLLR